MNRAMIFAPLCAALVFSSASLAQEPTIQGCPQLPADSGLAWEHRANGASDFCRAVRSDGSEAFGLYISPDPAFEPDRGNREEQARIDGREIHWYRAELAGRPGVEARETLVELRDGRMAHIWLQADSADQLQRMYRLAEALDFSQPAPAAASSGTQIAAGD